jgi:hypothetical protein
MEKTNVSLCFLSHCTQNEKREGIFQAIRTG